MQHLLEVYSQEFGIPGFFSGVGSSAAIEKGDAGKLDSALGSSPNASSEAIAAFRRRQMPAAPPYLTSQLRSLPHTEVP
jgi:hypothetical protein